MAMVRYNVIRNGDHWAIDENGSIGGEYVTREAAFEAAAAAASNLLKLGDGVSLIVDEPATTESGLGTKDFPQKFRQALEKPHPGRETVICFDDARTVQVIRRRKHSMPIDFPCMVSLSRLQADDPAGYVALTLDCSTIGPLE